METYLMWIRLLDRFLVWKLNLWMECLGSIILCQVFFSHINTRYRHRSCVECTARHQNIFSYFYLFSINQTPNLFSINCYPDSSNVWFSEPFSWSTHLALKAAFIWFVFAIIVSDACVTKDKCWGINVIFICLKWLVLLSSFMQDWGPITAFLVSARSPSVSGRAVSYVVSLSWKILF